MNISAVSNKSGDAAAEWWVRVDLAALYRQVDGACELGGISDLRVTNEVGLARSSR